MTCGRGTDMRRMVILLITALVTSAPMLARAATCQIHADDPNLTAALAQPVPTTNTIEPSWVDVGDRFLDFQGHWSENAPDVSVIPRMRHTHMQIPASIVGCEFAGPFTFPVHLMLFQTAGSLTGIVGENITNLVFDDPAVTTTFANGVWQIKGFTGNPADLGLAMKTAMVTMDPRPHAERWWSAYAAPLHGWYQERVTLLTGYDDGTGQSTETYWSLYSMVDPSQPETRPDDSRYLRVTDSLTWKGARVINSPFGTDRATGDDVSFRGANATQLPGPLPTFGTIIAPLSRKVLASSYGGGIFEPNGVVSLTQMSGMVLDVRKGQNLHVNVFGTPLKTSSVAICCGTELIYAIDPAVMGSGVFKLTANWNQTGGPAGTTFKGRRSVGSIITAGYAFDASFVPPPPPPPPVPAPCVAVPAPTPTAAVPITIGTTCNPVVPKQSYTLTVKAYEGTNDVHMIQLDGQFGTNLLCSPTPAMCSFSRTLTQSAPGTYVHTVRAVHRDGSPWPPVTFTETVQ